MDRDKFDVYRLAIEDTNQINTRRQAIDSLFTTIVTLVLSGDVYVGLQSRFDNWLIVAITGGVGIVGIIIVLRWNQARGELDEILSVRYIVLRKMEMDLGLVTSGDGILTDEYNNVYKKRESSGYRSATRRLATTFIAVFIVIPVVLLALTVAHAKL